MVNIVPGIFCSHTQTPTHKHKRMQEGMEGWPEGMVGGYNHIKYAIVMKKSLSIKFARI